MQFDLVSPERSLASLETQAVDIPGSEGDMTAMPDHAALMTTLKPGIVRVRNGEDSGEFIVTGGFVEITENGVIVLAETAYRRGEFTEEIFVELVSVAEGALEGMEGGSRDLAEKRLAETRSLRSLLTD